MKKNAVRAPIPQDERLAIALRFLARGESQTSLNWFWANLDMKKVTYFCIKILITLSHVRKVTSF